MSPDDAAQALVSGPRGRRLCAELVPWPGPDGSPASFTYAVLVGAPADAAGRRRTVVAALTDRVPQAATTDDDTLLAALADTVACARYWQEPEEIDDHLATDEARELLLHVARSLVVSAPWIRDGVRVEDQHCVLSRDEHRYSDLGDDDGGSLRRWREAALAAEARRLPRRLRPVTSMVSGPWWSGPTLSARPQTTRSAPGAGVDAAPMHLLLQEDSSGEHRASTRRLRPQAGARVLEVRGPADWVALAEQYPLVVTRSREHDWYRTTGRVGAWVQPDWAAVAVDHDAVHVTVAAYLSTAGHALPTGVRTEDGEAATVLAGWDPDVTWWLTDSLDRAGETRHWHREHDGEAWRPA